MNTYETITVDQLTNRAHTAYQRGCCGVPQTPDTFFAAQYWIEEKECWWTFAEAIDQEEAEREFAKWSNLRGSAEGMRILHIVPQTIEIEETTEEKENNMNGVATYFENDNLLDLVESVRATARNANGTFTAEEMLAALTQAADPEKDNFNLNARRVNSTLATLSSHMGGFELTEVADHMYEVTHA